MTKEHLDIVAKELVKAVLSERGENDEDICQIFSVVDPISVFLESEGFVEMKVLQELVLSELCTNLSSCLRRRYIVNYVMEILFKSLALFQAPPSFYNLFIAPLGVGNEERSTFFVYLCQKIML